MPYTQLASQHICSNMQHVKVACMEHASAVLPSNAMQKQEPSHEWLTFVLVSSQRLAYARIPPHTPACRCRAASTRISFGHTLQEQYIGPSRLGRLQACTLEDNAEIRYWMVPVIVLLDANFFRIFPSSLSTLAFSCSLFWQFLMSAMKTCNVSKIVAFRSHSHL